MRQLDDILPGFDDFIRIRGAEEIQLRHGAQMRQLLNRLMRRAVFPQANRIVGVNKDDRYFHQGR